MQPFDIYEAVLKSIYNDTRDGVWAELPLDKGERKLRFLHANGETVAREYALVDHNENERAEIVVYGRKDFDRYKQPIVHVSKENGQVFELHKEGNAWFYSNVLTVASVHRTQEGISFMTEVVTSPTERFTMADIRAKLKKEALKQGNPIGYELDRGNVIVSVMSKQFIKE